MQTNEVLEYIGLNLEHIPKSLSKVNEIHFRNYSSSNVYKIYDYISVHDLEILITPLDRTSELKDRLKEARPLFEYLTSDEKKIKNTFIEVLNSSSINEIKKLEELQFNLNNNIPPLIKYDKNYLWQIYYSAEDNKYFMLFPANEGETSVLFYIIKKKIEKEDTKIFVPINKLDYREKILTRAEINDIENYLWLFTNDWPNIYEVCQNELYIVGKAKVKDIFETYYRNVFKSKNEAKEFYMLLKALFVLTTETNYQYNFKPHINSNGELELKYNEDIINITNISAFIDKQVENKKKMKAELENEIKRNSKILEELKEYIKEQNNIYVMQEKQIVMFLECRKSFFKKISYYFKVKKFVMPKIKTKIEENVNQNKIDIEISSSYNIQDLINLASEVNNINAKARDIRADIRAMQIKKENLDRKIKNASSYIAEIEEHKKSIFEFWKFTNKDALPALQEAENKEVTKEKYFGEFSLEHDLEKLGVRADSLQRQKLTSEECNAIYLTLNTLNAINNCDDDNELNKVLKKYNENLLTQNDLFGNLLNEYAKTKKIKNREHREVNRNELNILKINKETNIDELRNNLEKNKKIIINALKKVNSLANMSIYLKDYNLKDELIIGEINPYKIIENCEDDVNIYEIKVNEGTNILYFTNIIFYDNRNNTLPVGMNLSTKVLLKNPKINLNKLKKEKIYLLKKKDDFKNILRKIEIKYQ